MKYFIVFLSALVFATFVTGYDVRFKLTFFGGERTHGSPNNFIRFTEGRAGTQQSTTEIGPRGVFFDERFFCEGGPEAFWFTLYNRTDNLWSETGNITFGFGGDSHRVHFTVFYSNRIDAWRDLSRGAGYGNITSGEGYYKGADGRLSWIYTHDLRTNSWIGDVTGEFWVPTPPPPPPSSDDRSQQRIHL